MQIYQRNSFPWWRQGQRSGILNKDTDQRSEMLNVIKGEHMFEAFIYKLVGMYRGAPKNSQLQCTREGRRGIKFLTTPYVFNY